MKPIITTYSGFHYNLAEPDPETISIVDIAHSLSAINRFGGHSRIPYSVAEHSWHVSYLVPEEHALAALLHDAHEAYVIDMPSPLKVLVPSYKDIEKINETAVHEKFGIPIENHFSIKNADIAMLLAEADQLLENRLLFDDVFPGISSANVTIKNWAPPLMKRLFLDRFTQLSYSHGMKQIND